MTVLTRAELEKISADQGDTESDLTDEELQKRLNALTSLKNSFLRKEIDAEGLRNYIRSVLNKRVGYSSSGKRAGDDPTVYESILNRFLEDQSFPTTDVGQAYRASVDEVKKNLNNYLPENDLSARYVENIKRVQDILTARGVETGKTKAATTVLSDIQKQLLESRSGFLSAKEASAKSFLESRIAPRVLSELNVRGLAEGPDVASVLTQEAGGLQSTIQSNIRDLEMQDAAFLTDAAFRIQAAKLDATEESYRAQLGLERTQAQHEQEFRFRTTENRIGGDFELDMLRREQERNLRLEKAGIDLGTSTARSSQIALDVGTVGVKIGEIVGTKLSQPKKTAPTEDGGTKQAPAFNLDRVG